MNKVGLIGATQTAADLAVAFYNTLRGEILALTGGILNAKEIEQTAVGAALDTFSALVSQNPDAQEALTEGIVRLMAMEFHRGGMSYERATSTLLAAFQTSWLALDEAKLDTKPQLPGLPSRADARAHVDTLNAEAAFDPMTGANCKANGVPCGFMSPGRCARGPSCPNNNRVDVLISASIEPRYSGAPAEAAVGVVASGDQPFVLLSERHGRVLDKFGVSHAPRCACVDGNAVVGSRCDCGALEQ